MKIMPSGTPAFILYVFLFSNQVFSFSAEFFGFWKVNSECRAYLAVDKSLVYSNPKIFLVFLSLILSQIPGLKSSFLIHISISLCLLLLDLASCKIVILSSILPSL